MWLRTVVSFMDNQSRMITDPMKNNLLADAKIWWIVVSGVAGAFTQDLILGFASPYVWLPGLSVLVWGLIVAVIVVFRRPDLEARFIAVLCGLASYVLGILEYQVLQMVKVLITAGLPLFGPWGILVSIPCCFITGMVIVHYLIVKISLMSGRDRTQPKVLFYAPGSFY
jgi:hypothetical protein